MAGILGYIQSHHSWTADYASSFEVQLFEQSVLKGSALSAIAGIPLTSENYSLVVKLLQERFGRKETIVESLYFKLQNLPKTGNKFADNSTGEWNNWESPKIAGSSGWIHWWTESIDPTDNF